jgi:hypothetical protein
VVSSPTWRDTFDIGVPAASIGSAAVPVDDGTVMLDALIITSGLSVLSWIHLIQPSKTQN